MTIRGGIKVKLCGKELNLLPTIGALAAIEESTGIKNINQLGEAAQSSKASMIVLHFAEAGGTPITKEELDAENLFDVMNAIITLLQGISIGDETPGSGRAKKKR